MRKSDDANAVQRENDILIQSLDQHALVSYTDPTGTILFANDLFCSLSKYSREELIGKNHRMLSSDVQDKDFWPTVWKEIQEHQSWQGEICKKAKDGSFYWVRGIIAPLLNSAGVIEKYLSICTDITAQKNIELQLKDLVRDLSKQTLFVQQYAAKAQEASTAKSHFIANVSHEIRTPMNGVIGMTELLLQSGLNGKQYQIAQTLKRSGEVLLSLINEVLDFSKIESGKFILDEIDFDLNLLLDDFAEALAIKAQEKGLELVCSIEPNVPLFLRGDPNRLRQILNNLSINANKFTSEGSILIHVSIVHSTTSVAAPISVDETTEKSVLLRFSVKDTGIGIPAEKIKKLFQMFTQVDGSTTRKFGGTGLGLAISKQLVELMGGTITVKSTEDEGSEFFFTMPFKLQSDRIETEKIPTKASVLFTGKTVLVVDGFAETRQALTLQLTSLGLKPTDVTSTLQAHQLLIQAQADAKPFDVVMIDTALLGSSLLVRTLKKDERLYKTPLIGLLTLVAQTKGDSKRLHETDFAALITKPIRRDDLIECMVAVLEKRKTRWLRHSHIALTASAPAPRRPERILLAEDNEVNQQVALGLLHTLGYDADVVKDGKEALAALATTKYALVLMDMMMPVMDGLSATREIRNPSSNVLNHQIPIIALTANITTEDRNKCAEAGMDDYISKPIAISTLKHILNSWLTGGSGERVAVQSTTTANVETPLTKLTKTHSSTPHSVEVFDEIGMLDLLGGNKDLAKNIATLFLRDTPLQIQQLSDLLTQQAVKKCEIQAHAIKGAAMTMGGVAVQSIAYELETTAKAGDLKKFALRLPELQLRYDEFQKILVDFIDNH